METYLERYQKENKRQKAAIEQFEKQVHAERTEKETTVVEKQRKVESLNIQIEEEKAQAELLRVDRDRLQVIKG